MHSEPSREARQVLGLLDRAGLAAVVVDASTSQIVEWNDVFAGTYGPPEPEGPARFYDLVASFHAARLRSLLTTTAIGTSMPPEQIRLGGPDKELVDSLVLCLRGAPGNSDRTVVLVCRPLADAGAP